MKDFYLGVYISYGEEKERQDTSKGFIHSSDSLSFLH